MRNGSPRRVGKRALRVLGAAAAAALWTSPLLGAEGAHEPSTVFGIPQWAVLAFNLAVFVGIIVYFAGPAVIRFLEDKGREIRHALEEAAEQQKEAAQMETRLREQIDELRREMDELLARAEREGERERQSIIEEAERERRRLEERTEDEIRRRLQEARAELTSHAVDLASRLARERIEGSLTAEDRKRLFRENLARLEER